MGNSPTVVCDLDGVLVLGSQSVPGAGEALARIRNAGYRLLFATNNSTRTAAYIADSLAARTGFAASPADVVTSGMATARHLRQDVERVFVVGEPGLVATLEAHGISVGDAESCDAVVVGLDRTLSYEKLTAATIAVRRGARLIATNDDATFPTPDGLVPGGGSIVAAVERATDERAEVCGKPHAPMAALVAELAGGGPITMVGDRIETDVHFGLHNGWQTVLVLTGVTGPEAASMSGADLVIPSIADLPGALGA